MVHEVQLGNNPGSSLDPVIIKLGKRKRKDIRKLAKGKGRLFSRVLETHARMRTEGGEEHELGPVVVLVKEKKRKNRQRWGSPFWS
jgi:hypothetical protein